MEASARATSGCEASADVTDICICIARTHIQSIFIARTSIFIARTSIFIARTSIFRARISIFIARTTSYVNGWVEEPLTFLDQGWSSEH